MIIHPFFKGCLLCLLLLITAPAFGQVVNVGSGSYTLTFPGTDAAGRNTFPSGTPFTTGLAATKPTPTNDWWSHKVKNSHSDNLFNYPFTMKTVNSGLVVSYIPWGVIDNIEPVIVGVTGLNASSAKVSDFSDWTVSMDWRNATQHFEAKAGIGMPFIYFTKDSGDVAQVTVNQGTVTISNEMLIIVDARNGADFAVYAPVGSVWTQTGNTYTSTLNGKNYWSLGFIPLNATNVTTVANAYKKYAYVFPSNTRVDWSYNEATSVVTTHFTVETEVKEGPDTTVLLGLLPHHWANLAPGSPGVTTYSYNTVRGQMKMLDGNSFTVENTFYGILPTLPYLDHYSPGFSPAKLNEKVKLLQDDGLNAWTDSYNEGQEMNRLIQTARVAELSGDTIALQKLLTTVKARLEDWLKVNGNEVAFIFYYNQTWSAMIGYPAGHGQDGNINDHHFHWGYFIHAAAFVEQFEPGWASQWGDMINLLVRDAASPNRQDNLFPFLRNFSPYAGHCWANGFASFPQGNDQESTSESMQFNSSLIHWGEITGNDSIRDLGIYLYTTEQTAVEEYWFDKYNRNFSPTHPYSLVSRVWGNSYDNGTFWTNDIAASYGIELYPIHGGSLYLGHDTTYVRQLWNEIAQNTGILTNAPNVNLWHDIMWEYLAFIDPEKAIELYDSYPERSLKFGVSDAQTYHWLHSMNVLGNVEVSLTANHPLAAAFHKDGSLTYVAQNYGTDTIDVVFSDGYVLEVPPKRLVTSKDVAVKGVLTSSFSEAYPGGSVDLTAIVSGGNATKVEFYDGSDLVGQATAAPFVVTASGLSVGRHHFYAKVYDGAAFNITNIITVIVGQQRPYSGSPVSIPGTFQAAHYDVFEGGVGNGIAYQDASIVNEGNFRLNEYVDAETKGSEGDIVGWIVGGEWLEYTVDVQQAGNYNLTFRFACGNSAGGGPFRIESDGLIVKSGITVTSSGGWNNWANKSVTAIPLKSGKQVLRIYFENGELNVGKFTFTYVSPLSYSQPVADAGENQIIVLPQNTATLDGSASIDPNGGTLNYNWTQVYGPSTLTFSNSQVAQPTISSLAEGVYLMKLKIDNGSYADEDEVYIISSLTPNVAPTVALLSPLDNSEYIEGEMIDITALASDLNDSIQMVRFYADGTEIGNRTQPPYTLAWTSTPGVYSLTAVAFDHNNDSTTSDVVTVEFTPAPSCNGVSWNGDFAYEFSDADNNPTITFISNQPGVGTPTCILYYGTDPGNMPGYGVTRNVPFQINATKGTKIYFYYTYSFPGAVEKNNADHKDTYVIGSCKTVSIRTFETMDLKYYPNPVTDILNIELPNGMNEIAVYDMTGRLIYNTTVSDNLFKYDMRECASSVYFITVINNHQKAVLKVVK
ncbi:MAG: glycosyl hydrolase [Bacteroidia bacterium]